MLKIPARRRLSTCSLAAALTVFGSGCTTIIAGYHQLRVVGADDMGPETAKDIEALSKQLDQHVAADDFEAAMSTSKALWEISSGSCNSCQSAAWPALYRFSEAVLATPTTKPAYQAAAILKRASTEAYADRSYDGPSAGLDVFRAEVQAAFASVEARAKPELVAKAAALETAGHPASAVVVLGQLLALYPDDTEAKAHRDALVDGLRKAHAFTLKATGGPAAEALARSPFVEAVFFGDAPINAVLTVNEPTTEVQTAAEAQTASVVRGKKTVPNRDYERLQEKIAHTEKLRSEDQAALAKGQSVKSNQSDIASRTRQIADLQKQLARESPTEQVDNRVDESFPGTRHTRTVRRGFQVRVVHNSEVLAEGTGTAGASRSVVVHGGYPDAHIAPKSEPVPDVASVDVDTIANAASQARAVVLQAYRSHLSARLKPLIDKGDADAIEAAATQVLLDPAGNRDADATAVKKGLQVADPRTFTR